MSYITPLSPQIKKPEDPQTPKSHNEVFVSIVVIGAQVLKHQATSNYNPDTITVVIDLLHKKSLPLNLNALRRQHPVV